MMSSNSQDSAHTSSAVSSFDTVLDALRFRAAVQPDRAALGFFDPARDWATRITYAELDAEARDVAAGLLSHRLHGERVLVPCFEGLETIGAVFGCLYAGVIAVPVPPLDPNDSPRYGERWAGIVKDCQPAAIYTASNLGSRARSDMRERYRVEVLCRSDLKAETALDASLSDSGDLAYLQYTSGSTGSPRGVMVAHENIAAYCWQIDALFSIDHDWRWVGWLPLFHDMGMLSAVMSPIYSGYESLQMTPWRFLEKPIDWLRSISAYRGSITGAPDFAYQLCARSASPEVARGLALDCLKVARNGSEPVKAATMRAFSDTFSAAGFDPEAFCPSYGLAEATLGVSYGYRASPGWLAVSASALSHGLADSGAQGRGSAMVEVVNHGPPLPGNRVVIVDPETRRLMPDRAVGEIWVRGPNVALGYWGDAERTAQTFRAELAVSPGQCFLRTGDLGFLQSGNLYVTGRLKDILKVRGMTLYPQDVEATVAACAPEIRASRTVAFAPAGFQESRVAVAFELRASMVSVDGVGDLIERVRLAVARRHGIQLDAVYIIPRGSLPKTSSGKLARTALREGLASGRVTPTTAWLRSTPHP